MGQTKPVNTNGKFLLVGDTVQELAKDIMLVYQDSKEVYWFGTWQNGVYSYDGNYLIHYSEKHGLQSNRIDEIKEDEFGNLFFVALHPTASITKFDGQSFSKMILTESTDWKLQDKDIWIRNAYQTEKVIRYDGKIFHELTLARPKHLQMPFEIYSIYKDSRGNLWFGTNPLGVCRYDGKSFNWITEEDLTEFRNEGANGVRSIVEDSSGDFWFNTEFRYGIYDSLTLKSDKFYTRKVSIGPLDGKANSDLDEYLSALKDTSNNLWFVSYLDGVWKYDTKQIRHYAVQENGKNISLFSIYQDKYGILWLGSHENGVYQFNGQNFEKFELPFNLN